MISPNCEFNWKKKNDITTFENKRNRRSTVTSCDLEVGVALAHELFVLLARLLPLDLQLLFELCSLVNETHAALSE